MKIRGYKSGDEADILKLFEEVFNVKRSINRWNWQFKNHIQGPGCITVVEAKSEIVGHYGIMRNHLNFMGLEIVAGQSCDTMLRRDFRGEGLLMKTGKFTYKQAQKEGVYAIFGFPNRDVYPGRMRNLDWHRIAILKYYYYRIGFRKLADNKMSKLLSYFYLIPNQLKYYIDVKRLSNCAKIQVMNSLPDNLNNAVKEYLNHEVLSIWKDLPYLKWRYQNHPEHQYDFHILFVKGRPEGFAVCRNTGSTVAICDLIHRTKNVVEAVFILRHLLNYYRKSDAQKIEFYGYDSGFFGAIFSAAGFEIIPISNLLFGGRVLSKTRLKNMFALPQNWTISYGDTDII